jgi:hypothetical protein
MADEAKPERPRPAVGTIGWQDLTVPDADKVRDFYAQVVGWEPEPVEMGGYSDYNMKAPGGGPVAGVCHARGQNADQPAQWMLYVVVADLDAAVERCRAAGGKVRVPAKSMGGQTRYCVIEDPAGAVCGLYQAGD